MDFTFDRAFGSSCTQPQIYESVVHVIQGVMEGINGTVMVYGQVRKGLRSVWNGGDITAYMSSGWCMDAEHQGPADA